MGLPDERMRNSTRRFMAVWLTGLLLVATISPALASDPLAGLKAQFALADSRVDFAVAKLTVD